MSDLLASCERSLAAGGSTRAELAAALAAASTTALLGQGEAVLNEAIGRLTEWVTHTPDAVTLHAPVADPGKIVGIGLNYRDHAAETNMPVPSEPVVFAKWANAVLDPHGPIVRPAGCRQLDWEVELGVVIGRRAKRVTVERALEHVFGYTVVNDVSARDFQFVSSQWTKGKAADTFCPMGPCIVDRAEIPDPQSLAIRAFVNDELMQQSSTAQMVFGVADLVAFLSGFMTLDPGDIIATGTPPGVGMARKPPRFLQPGDVCRLEIERIGVLENPVVDTAAP